MTRESFALIRVFAALLLAAGVCVSALAPARGGEGVQRQEITVSAAVSLKEALTEVGRLYESRTSVRVTFNFGASGLLQKQIEAGAPVDVFVSAGARQMDALEAAGLIAPDSRRDIAANELVLVVPPGNPPLTLEDLAGPRPLRVALGNPKTVPAGQYALQALTRLGLWNAVQERAVYGEDVRQVLEYVVRGEVDAGLVYASDVRVAPRLKDPVRVPRQTHDPILYPAAVVEDSDLPAAARQFVDLVAGPEGQKSLARHGFLPPPLT